MRQDLSSGLSAIILSAGFSSRMNGFKPLMPCCGKSMLERTIALFQDSGIKDIVVVTGHNSRNVEPVVQKNNAVPVHNPDFEKGMLSSIQKGVKSIHRGARGFFLLPVDIPAVRVSTVREMLLRFRASENRIIIPSFGRATGHPPLIPAVLKKKILALDSGSTLRDLLLSGDNRIRDVRVHDRGILMDADDRQGYETVCRKIKKLHIPDTEECRSIIHDVLPDDDRIKQHLEDVCTTALKLARSLDNHLDTDLIAAAALLHDIKRKEKAHAIEGARFIRHLGFKSVGDIIAQHMDITINPAAVVPEEKEIVYFADKLCNDKGLDLDYHKRFAACLKKSPWAMAGISKRYENTRQIHARIEAAAGRPVEKILAA